MSEDRLGFNFSWMNFDGKTFPKIISFGPNTGSIYTKNIRVRHRGRGSPENKKQRKFKIGKARWIGLALLSFFMAVRVFDRALWRPSD